MCPMVHKCPYFLILWCTNATEEVHKDTYTDEVTDVGYNIRERPLFCVLFIIRTTFGFRWVGGLRTDSCSN